MGEWSEYAVFLIVLSPFLHHQTVPQDQQHFQCTVFERLSHRNSAFIIIFGFGAGGAFFQRGSREGESEG